MELRYENGWTGNGWMFSGASGLRHNAVARRITPPADVIEGPDAYRFYFEIPGLKGESIDVRVENDALTIAAERKRPELGKESRVLVAERGYGSIRRAFELPEDASRDNIRASYRDGVLEVTVEKRAESKPVKITIN